MFTRHTCLQLAIGATIGAMGAAARSGTLTLLAVLLAAGPLAGMAGPASPAAAAVTVRNAPSISCPTTPYGYNKALETYGSPANGQPMDLVEYRPSGDAQAKVPGVILVHGGGWEKGNFTEASSDALASIGECLAENGFDAFSVDYALTVNGGKSFPQNLQDINEAIGWVKVNVTNLDTAEMFILGTSAGANLAELAGENAMGYTDRLHGVIAQSGPADLSAAGMGCASKTTCVNGSPGATIEKYLGCYDNSTATCTLQYENGTTEQVSAATAYADASPTASLSASVPAPPFLIANSGDEEIPLAQATDLTQLLNAQCAATGAATSDQLVVIPGDQHALTYSDILAGPTLDFLNAVLGGTLPANCTTASPLTGAAMAYDAAAGAKADILFGGCCTSSGMAAAATETFDAATNTWNAVTINGPAPVPRLGATLAYDPVSGDLILFGGEYLPGGSAQPVALNDTWELSYDAATNTGTWTQVDGSGCLSTCANAPSARYGAAADQAPSGQGMVLFGGENLVPATQSGFPQANAETWLWNGSSWAQLTPSASPGAAYGATLAYGGLDNADVLFGGDHATSACDGSCLALNSDTWTLTYTSGTWTWTEQAAAPANLTARDFAAAASAVGSATGGMVLFGGMTGTTPTTSANVNSDQLLGDTWTWNGTAWTQACTTCTVTPPPALGASMAHEANTEDLLYGGYTDAAAPAAPSATWLWTGSWAAG